MPDRIQAILNLPRAIAQSGTAYRESGMGGVAEAFSDPTPFEQSSRAQGLSAKNREFLTSVNQTIDLGDTKSAYAQIFSLRDQLKDEGVRPGDIDNLTAPLMQRAYAHDITAKPADTPEGQRNLMRVNAMVAPQHGAQIANIGAGLPEARAREGLVRQQTSTSQAAEEGQRFQTQNLYPAQVREEDARAGYYERGGGTGGAGSVSRENSLRSMMSQGRDRVKSYDTQMGKGLADPMMNPEQMQGLLEMRNFEARQSGAPELELRQVIDAAATPDKESGQKPMMWALAVKEPPKEQPAEQGGGGGTIAGLLGGGAVNRGAPVAPPEMSPGGAAAQAPQSPSAFNAAVGNPLGALPPPLQQAIMDPQQPIGASNITRAYMSLGMAEPQANYLADLLIEQLRDPSLFGQQAQQGQPTMTPQAVMTPTPAGRGVPTQRPY